MRLSSQCVTRALRRRVMVIDRLSALFEGGAARTRVGRRNDDSAQATYWRDTRYRDCIAVQTPLGPKKPQGGSSIFSFNHMELFFECYLFSTHRKMFASFARFSPKIEHN
jgi:hypothetical protein